ncbi:nucleic acid/nucleotide deaminase domain-containing protein [Embleya sp. NPDC005971]|uniref:nucleic acid/nucleotide deaminase domain-containing protein n=1 Tax=unclassified Embleya TaxID=2699296 RepID=UPI0033E74A13
MNSDLSAALHQRFGRDGLRFFGSTQLAGVPLPVQVGAYFLGAEDEHPPTMGAFADSVGESLPDPAVRERVRLGTDQGAELYVAADGSVRALFLGVDLPEMPVASDVEAFAAGLLTLDQALPRIAAVDEPAEGFPLFRALREELLALDPAAFAEREAWWPRVLDDVRLPLNIAGSAAFEILDADGSKQIVTEVSRPGLPHPEELLWYRLSAGGVPAEDVLRVYCELEPCLMPGHYCALWMGRMFPAAEFTHSFGYGESAQSREDGVRALMTHVAEQAGNR